MKTLAMNLGNVTKKALRTVLTMAGYSLLGMIAMTILFFAIGYGLH